MASSGEVLAAAAEKSLAINLVYSNEPCKAAAEGVAFGIITRIRASASTQQPF